MWVSRKKLDELVTRIEKCEKKIQEYDNVIELRLRSVSKKILEQPEELLEEIKNIEHIERMIDEFIQC